MTTTLHSHRMELITDGSTGALRRHVTLDPDLRDAAIASLVHLGVRGRDRSGRSSRARPSFAARDN